MGAVSNFAIVKSNVIHSDPNVLGGTPVFKGTRVPIEALFDHLEDGVSIDEFLADFPTVTKDQVVQVLELAGNILTSKNFQKLYEAAA